MAATITSSSVWTTTGTLLQPGDLRSRSSTLRDRSTIVGKQRSVLFTITNVGTFSAIANPKCSFVVPTKQTKYQSSYKFVKLSPTVCEGNREFLVTSIFDIQNNLFALCNYHDALQQMLGFTIAATEVVMSTRVQ